jgi:restriction system protein
LKKAGLIESPVRGQQRITQTGRDALGQHPTQIDSEFLKQFPSFVEWIGKKPDETEITEEPTSVTPEELLESSYSKLRAALADDLIDRVKSCSPQFFERLVVQLLVAMGYGGSLKDAGQAIGRSGDAGIDGIIKEDHLGLDVVCIQAKRWTGTVGGPDVRGFAGSMEGYRARKGVMITTSSFSRDAEEFVKHIERKIVLIDGKMLAQFMIDFGIGVSESNTYVVKRLNHDYFVDEDA